MAESVLLVDDEVEFIETLAERMRARGLRADTAYNGDDAIKKAAQHRYDAFVLDLAMPGMDGMGVLRHLLKENPDRQVILLTGQGTVKAAKEATKLGAMDFLEKPTEIDNLIELIKEARANRLALEMKASEDKIADLMRRRGW